MAEMINITPTADMPPVSTTTTGTTSGSTSSGITESPEAAQARQLEQESIKAQAGFADAAGEQIPVVEEQKAAGADAQAQLLEQQAAEAQKVRENYLQRIEYAQTQAARARQQFESFQFHNYWDTLSTGQQIQSRIARGLGGFASGVNGGPNYILQDLQDKANRDFEMQKQQLSKKERSADWAMKGVTDLYGQMQHDMAALEIKHGLALKAVAEKAQAALTRAGIPAAQAANDATVQGLMATAYAKDLAAKQRYEQHYDRTQQQKAEQQTTAAKARAAMVFDAQGNPIAPAPSPEAATKLRGELDVAQQAKALIDRLQKSYADKGATVDADTIRDRREAQSELKALIPGLKGLNRLTHEEVELFGTVTGGNIDAVLGSGGNTMKRLDESLNRMVSSHLSAQGIKPTPETVARVFAGPLTTGPAETSSAAPSAPTDVATIQDKIARTNAYLRDNPGAEDAADARASLQKLHAQLHVARGKARAATQPQPFEATP